MSIKVEIAGTQYGVVPDSLQCEEALEGGGKAKFRIRQSLSGSPTRFVRGKEVKIYETDIHETICTSNTYGPWGATSVRCLGHNIPYEQSRVEAHIPNSLRGAQGTFEANICYYDAPTTDHDVIPWVVMYSVEGGIANLFVFGLEVYGGKVYPLVRIYAYTNGSTPVYREIDHSTSNIPNLLSYRWMRFTVNWVDYGSNNTDFQVMFDGILVDWFNLGGDVHFHGSPDDEVNLLNSTQTPGVASNFDVAVNDVRMWNTARGEYLVRPTIRERVQNPGSESALSFYYKMDENSGNHCHDSGPNTCEDAEFVIVNDSPYWNINEFDFNPCGDKDYENSYTLASLDTRYFGGKIEAVKDEILQGTVIETSFECVDYGFLTAKRLVTVSVIGKNVRFAAQEIAKDFLTGDFIGSQCMPEGRPITEIAWVYVYANKALSQLKDSGRCVWYVDSYKELRCHEKDYRSAPFDMLNTDSPKKYLQDSMHYNKERGKYYNRVVAKVQRTIGTGTSQEQVEDFIVVEDAAEIVARAAIEGGSGVYEYYVDLGSAGSVANAVDVAVGILDQSEDIQHTVTYWTRETGLHPGMWQHIENDELEFSLDFLLMNIQHVLYSGADMRHFVTAKTSTHGHGLLETISDAMDSKANFKVTSVANIVPVNVYSHGRMEGVSCSDTATVQEGT